MLEGQRALLELASLLPAAPWLGLAPRGDGHPVLVLPGFTAIELYEAKLWKLGLFDGKMEKAT